MVINMLKISDKAQQHFAKLLNKQKQGTQIRLFLKKKQDFRSEFGICYYFPKQNDTSEDIIIKFDLFSVYFKKIIIPLVKGTMIDLVSNNLGINLSIYSPNLYYQNSNITNHESSLEDKIKNILHFQINPQLALHGGKVTLIKITKDLAVILQFHGGCNGCQMAYYTVKAGIEKTLKQMFPQLKEVIDITKHKRGSHSYY